MKRQTIAALAVTTLVITALSAIVALAGPIIKPKKYYGPIPQNSFSLRGGFHAGADNSEMLDYWETLVRPPLEGTMDSFGNGLSFDAGYTYKAHPQFGFRVNTSATFLRSEGSGVFVDDPGNLPDSLVAPGYNYSRNFDVDIFTVEVSGMYYFTDASVKEFQPYIGAGFTIGIPHEKFKEDRVDLDTGVPVPGVERDEWSGEAGVNAYLGAQYYVTNRTAFSVEGRLQMLQSKFPISVPNELGEPEDVKFDVDYSGFFMMLGVVRAF